MSTNADAQNRFCPFLGLSDDPQSLMAYISPQNHCYRCKPVVAVKLDHQNNFCLDTTYVNCPAYNNAAGKPLPGALRYKVDKRVRRRNWMRLALGAVIGAVLIGAVYFLLALPPRPAPSKTPSPSAAPATATWTVPATATGTPRVIPTTVGPSVGTDPTSTTLTASPFPSLTPTVYTATPTRTPTAIFTGTATPTFTPSLTATKISGRALDVPIGRGRAYLIHRVAGGENLNSMAEKYQTSIEAILAVNYSLSAPIWADDLVVIPLGVASPEGLPIFEPYQVAESNLTAESLAGQLGCDSALFKYFNELADGEVLKKGDWLLIPRDEHKQE